MREDLEINCAWDITHNYLVFKTNGEPISLDKRYLVLNLIDKQHRQAALAYASNSSNTELAQDLQARVQINEQLDDYLAQCHKAARHSDDPFWTSHVSPPQLPALAEEERTGLYAKYQIRDRQVNPVEGDFFVLAVDEESAEVKAALNILGTANASVTENLTTGGKDRYQ